MVDDANVETPGVCHLESWVTRYDGQRGLANSSPACTSSARPRLEIGGAIQHTWDGADDTTAGPALKLNLRPLESGFALGLIGAGAWSLRSGRLQTASVIVPVTADINESVRANFNAGWLYGRASQHRHNPRWRPLLCGAVALMSLIIGPVAKAQPITHKPPIVPATADRFAGFVAEAA